MLVNLRIVSFGSAVLGVALAASGCGDKNNKQVKTSGGGEAKSSDQEERPDDPGSSSSTDARDAIAPGSSLILANYYVTVKSLGIQQCTGGVQLKVNANMGSADGGGKMLDIPEGKLSCALLGEIDLTQILGSAAGQSSTPPVVTVQNETIHLSAIGGGVFTQNPASDPGRPMFPSFIAGDPKKLAVLNYIKPLTVISQAEGNKTASGSVTLKMLYFNKLYESPHMKRKRPFPKTMAFETTTQGFDGVNKIINMLFDRMEFRISLDPLAITYISFKGKIADLGGGLGGLLGGGGGAGGAGGLGGGLFGTILQAMTKVISIEFEAHLVEQQGLSYKTAEEEDNQEEIGGKKTAE
jgi:hypothetical protein